MMCRRDKQAIRNSKQNTRLRSVVRKRSAKANDLRSVKKHEEDLLKNKLMIVSPCPNPKHDHGKGRPRRVQFGVDLGTKSYFYLLLLCLLRCFEVILHPGFGLGANTAQACPRSRACVYAYNTTNAYNCCNFL